MIGIVYHGPDIVKAHHKSHLDPKENRPTQPALDPNETPLSTFIRTSRLGSTLVDLGGTPLASRESSRGVHDEEQGGVSEKWVGVDDVAGHLGVAKDSVYRWIERRGLPARKVGRLLRFKLSEVDAWVDAGSGEGNQGSEGGGPKGRRGDAKGGGTR